MLFSIFLSEIIIISFSYLFYREIEFSIFFSVLASILTELLFMISSSSTSKILKLMKYPIFLYSIFTISYFTYSSDSKISLNSTNIKNDKIALERKLLGLESNRKLYKEQLNDLYADLAVYRKLQYISIGREKTKKEKTFLNNLILKNSKRN